MLQRDEKTFCNFVGDLGGLDCRFLWPIVRGTSVYLRGPSLSASRAALFS